MSVYKPASSRFWLFDFQYKGTRFHGSTGQTSRRAAEQVERQRRLEAATGVFGQVGQMTLDEAAGRWWGEVGIERGDAVDVERRLSRLIQIIGSGVVLSAINQETVAKAIQFRRGQGLKRSKAKDAKTYLPSNATVNRDIIETLRPILKRAKTHWALKETPHGLPEISWRELRLSEPRGQSRSYSEAERAAWIEHAAQWDLGLAIELLLTYGLRFSELMFSPDSLGGDSHRPTLTLQKGRKRDVLLEVALTREHGRLLKERAERARQFGLGTLWFEQVGVYPDGSEKMEAYSPHQVEYRISKAADLAGIKGGRRIHGARHHAAGAILRDTKNLKAVQALLGHASIQSSQRYTHVLNDDLRDVIEARTNRGNDFGTISGLSGETAPIGPVSFRKAKPRKKSQKP